MALIQKARTVTLRDLNSDRTVNSGDSLASELGGDPLAIVGSTNDDPQRSELRRHEHAPSTLGISPIVRCRTDSKRRSPSPHRTQVRRADCRQSDPSSLELTVAEPTLVRLVGEGQHAQHAKRARVDSLRTATVGSEKGTLNEQLRSPEFAPFDPPVAQLMKTERSGMRQFA